MRILRLGPSRACLLALVVLPALVMEPTAAAPPPAAPPPKPPATTPAPRPAAAKPPAPGVRAPDAVELAALREGRLLPDGLWLEDLDLTKARTGWGSAQARKSFRGNPLRVAGVTYPHGVGTQAVTRMAINLNGAVRRFVALLGADDEAPADPSRSSVSVLFEVDGKKLQWAVVPPPKQAPAPVGLDLHGAKRLTILVRPRSWGSAFDRCDFLSAMFVLDPAAGAKPEIIEQPNPCLPEPPLQPGAAGVRLEWTYDDLPYHGQYWLYVPPAYARDPKAKLPTILFLHGGGEIGPDLGRGPGYGPPQRALTEPDFGQNCPFLIISPQLQGGMDWHDPPAAAYAMAAVDALAARLPVDPDRLYVTGISLGGTGTWRVAMDFPDRLAAAAPFCGRACDPERAAARVGDLPIWAAVGEVDGPFTAGTREMIDTLRRAGKNPRLTVFPGANHFFFPEMYARREVYDWFLSHRRGRPGPALPSGIPPWKVAAAPAATRQSTATAPAAPFADDLARLAPGWQVADLGAAMPTGLRSEWNGRKGVLVTHPRDARTPCRLTRTIILPPATPSAAPATAPARPGLHLVVGRHLPAGEWLLVVNANDQELLRRRVDRQSAPQGWLTADIDLSPFAGQQVKLELLNGPTGWVYEAGYWAEIVLKGAK